MRQSILGADLVTLNPNILWALAALLAVLVVASLVRLVALRGATDEQVKQHLGSLKTWWVLAVLLAAVVLLGQTAAALLFAATSVLAVREFTRLIRTRRDDRWAVCAAYLSIPVNYLLIWLGWREAFVIFVPLWSVMLLTSSFVIGGDTGGFVRKVAGLHWGTMLVVYCLSHAVLVFALPESSNPVAGGAGWFLYLVLLTEANDILQAVVGRALGRHKITPRVSPRKTWEGFSAGVAGTALLAVALAPLLTPLAAGPTLAWGKSQVEIPYLWAALAGLLIAVGGFFGDITMSSVKRDAGAKDSGSMLPGQGGILDRIDSLTFSAPLFYYYVNLLYGI